jgi:hypothetical protein
MSSEQLVFDIARLVEPTYEKHLSIQERFESFNKANPWVANALERLAEDWMAHGYDRVGIKALVEIVRWQYGRATRSTPAARAAKAPKFKVNNDYTSRYARLLIERHPDWAGFIYTRELRRD